MNVNLSNVALITKQDYIDYTSMTRPKAGTPGGGIATKTQYVKEAVPEMTLSSKCNIDKLVLLIEPLSVHDHLGGDEETNITALEKSNALKILWCEEQEILRWSGRLLDKVLDIVDGVAVSNKYLQQQLSPIVEDRDIQVLYTPIAKAYSNQPRKEQVFSMSQISLRKNVDMLMELYGDLPDTINSVFVGNAGLWGDIILAADQELEPVVASVCDKWIASATRSEVVNVLTTSKYYMNMAFYDVGCLSFLEAAMAGCACLCWNYHPMFDEYKGVVRFEGIDDGLEKIGRLYDNPELWGRMSEGVQAEVEAKHSYDAFRQNLADVIVATMLG